MSQLGTYGTRAWSDMGGDLSRISAVEAVQPAVSLASRLDVVGLATDSVAVATLAIHEHMLARGLVPQLPRVRVSGERVATSIRSDRFMRIYGVPPESWGELSGFFEVADGWVRTHANYPHHGAALRLALGLAPGATRGDVVRAMRGFAAQDIEDRAAAGNAVAVRVRSREEWARHAQAVDLATQPLVSYEPLGFGEVQGEGERRSTELPSTARPLAGVRVLDLTRVIAGPVATRDLAFAGADVLRIDSPHLPEIEWQHLDTGHGKRSALLDLRSRSGRQTFEELLSQADVVITGYRPGSLGALGLTPERLTELRPGVIVGQVSAWGTSGPWMQRRGFDSIVQAASGVALIESDDGVTPGALPAQALDHAAGHLLAAGLIRALTDRHQTGEGRHVSLALARIAQELMDAGIAAEKSPDHPGEPTLQHGISGGIANGVDLVTAAPALTYEGAPQEYARMSDAWGSTAAHWA